MSVSESLPSTEGTWAEYLKNLQNRIFSAIDISIDGGLGSRYQIAEGRCIRIQIDLPSCHQPRIGNLIDAIEKYLQGDNEYGRAIRQSMHIKKLRVTMNNATVMTEPRV